MRDFPDRIVVASHNAGKVREIRELLEPLGCEIVSAVELDLPEPEETGETFEENARIKALAAARATGIAALSDDSGLCVDALGGKPGIHSARWAGLDKDFALAMRNVEEALAAAGAATPDRRRARFVAVLCLAWPDGHTQMFRGEVEGVMVWPPCGEQGFGYDPVFLPDGHARTFGEMSAREKHGWRRGDDKPALSHRARAFKALVEAWFGDA
ncbi:MAG: RdgB/HAM1 family non-canonical purine NTP pyrophosphatase [Rhodobiaceae bacterium]|nr:RdgB/HAM1 family non-canonical purine NTP pyrophosphatase [Rhodobiaceae bacterium]MCC0016012.1 RdgB/HAM1 family non-canonical purine NTP pyrophosphatase [Rhodobiaceae bacterium]MCC0042302.1 RdgB/HAM1 family non-canonical purine NTP pyrophosphatase [Rhodobiaceae bacterium]